MEDNSVVCHITNADIDQPVSEVLRKVRNYSSLFLTELQNSRKVEVLSFVLPNCTNLTTLILARNHFTDAEIRGFATILPRCTQIEHLIVMNNRMSNVGLSELIKVVPQMNKLIILFFNGEHLSIPAVKKLAGLLPQCAALERLVLWKTGVTNVGIAELVKVLPKCLRLELIDLTTNKISDKGAVELVKVLPQCSQITTLHLRENSISTAGARALAEILPSTYIQAMELNRDESYLEEQNCIVPALENNIARRKRAQLVLECFYHDMALPRLFSDDGDVLTKQDFMNFRFWEKNFAFWNEVVGKNNDKEKKAYSKRINDYINQHYLEITGVIKNMDNLKKDKPVSAGISLPVLPLHVLCIIFSNLQLEDVNSS